MANDEQLSILKQEGEVWNKSRPQKHHELRPIQARQPKIRSASDFLMTKGWNDKSHVRD